MGKRKNAQNGGAESKVADKSNKNEKLDLWFRFKSRKIYFENIFL